MTSKLEEPFKQDEIKVNSKTVHLFENQELQLSISNKKDSSVNGSMSEKSETENVAPNPELEIKKKIESLKSQEPPQPEKKEIRWPYTENVKRDSFGFILRTDPLPLDKPKKTDNHDVNNVDSKGKNDKKSEKGKDDRYDDGKKERGRDRDRDRDKHRDRDRSPHGYKRKYSRSPSPRRSRHRRSRSRSRTPRDPRLRRNMGSSSDRYRYRRYSSEKSPDKDSDKSDIRSSSPRRERSRTPSQGWRSNHTRSGPVDPRNPPSNLNSRQDYVSMVPAPFPPAAPVPPPNTNSPGNLSSLPENNNFNRYQPPAAAPVPPPAPPQYNYAPPPPTSATETYPGYDMYYSGYPPPPPHPPPQEYLPPNTNNWQREVNPPPKPAPAPAPVEDPAKKEAIEKELLQQKITLSKQRDEYLRKGIILNRELELLKTQKKELLGDKTRDSEKLLKENNKLQMEINSKIKAVDNVIDILTGIIGDTRPVIPLEDKTEGGKTTDRESSREKEKSSSREKEKKRSEKRSKEDSSESGEQSSSDDSSSDSNSDYHSKARKTKKKKRRRSETNDENLAPPGTESLSTPEARKEDNKPLFNFIYYDPEMHWCQVCDEFPRTAKEYLNHLHSKQHKELTQEKKVNDMPWHDLNVHEEVPFYEGAPTKRIPIKGLQFLVSATAWFCKLCRMWIGDLHCVSLHLKSKEHSANYASFNEQNPHWETDWMANREKAYEKCAEQRRRLRDEELLQKQKQERMELMKKQEEELKQKFFSSVVKPPSTEAELIMPLTLPRSFEGQAVPAAKENVEVKKEKEKEKKKKAKKEKKKKEKRVKEKKKKSKEKKSKKSSSSESGSSSDSSSESSDSEDEKKYKKELLSDLENRSKGVKPPAVKSKEKPEEEKPPEPIPITMPEKSKWEMDEVVEPKPVPPPEPNKLVEVKEQTVKEDRVEEKSTKEWSKGEDSKSEKESRRSEKDRVKSKDRRDYDKDDDRSSRYDKKRRDRYDKRSESSRRERRSSWDRKKDYRSSRHRRSRTRSRSRSNSREREREKVTPGVIPAPLYDLFKLPDKHSNPFPDSKSDKSESRNNENDDGESKFEKQAVEAAKKKKVQPVVNLPKSKFGFIGRMPFAKKRGDEKDKKGDESPRKDESAELEAPPPPRITQPRPPSPKGPKPVLTTKTKVETAKEIVSKYQKAFQEKVEEAMPMDPMMVMEPVMEMPNPPLPPPPPVLTMMPPSPPKIKESPKSPKKVRKSLYPLPKDFQDALSIIYPEEKPDDKTDFYSNPEFMAMYQMYGSQMMMYPGMHMMAPMPQMPPGPPVAPHPHMMNMFNQTAPPPPTSEPSRETPSPPAMPPPPENLFETSFGLGSSTGGGIPGLDEEKMETSSKMSDDDMALLGIDAEDMAAQQL